MSIQSNYFQTSITDALTDMEMDLCREMTRALKQTMMQELLTGRTRLI